MNTLPTSDAVLDALAKAIAERDYATEDKWGVWHGVYSTDYTPKDMITAWAKDKGAQDFPATRQGLTDALRFAGLQIDGGDNATA